MKLVSFVMLVLFLCASALSACSDPKAANEGNFAKVINESADSLVVFLDEMPVEEFNKKAGGDHTKLDGDHYLKVTSASSFGVDSARIALVNDLVKNNVISLVKKGLVDSPVLFRTEEDVYLLKADNVKQAIVKQKSRGMQYGFYCGKPVVDKVLSWTEPGNVNGFTVTQVKYTAKVGDAPKWASDILKRYNDELAKERSTVLVLTNKGWSVDY